MYGFLRVVVGFLYKIVYRIEINGKENFPDEGPFVICANHTHVFDPVTIAIIKKKRINFVAKKELFEKKIFSKFFTNLGAIPIDRAGNDLKAIKQCFKVIRNGGILGIFPEGTRVKNIDINNMKKGPSLIALKNKTNILPIHIESSYKIFSKMKVDIYPIINTNDYNNLEESEAIDKLTEDLFNAIYQNKI